MRRDRPQPVALRGQKSWGLLAHLLLTSVPPSRSQLAALLFPEADDPLGALRWSLSELRRALGPDAVITGDPVRLSLADSARVDVLELSRGAWRDLVALEGLGSDLLAGVEPAAGPGFELWLAEERRRIRGLSASVLREAAHESLAAGAAGDAIDFARRLVDLEPLDENHHVLLVRCLARAGRRADAKAQAALSARILERELGLPPSDALERAAIEQESEGDQAPGEPAGRPRPPPDQPAEAVVSARLRKAQAAVSAGAGEEGIRLLRSAATAARQAGERVLLARVLVAIGEALVGVARGGDEEGAAALHEAGAIALEVGEPAIRASALRELAWVEYYRGRYDRLTQLLDEAEDLARDDERELVWLHVIRGGARADTGRHEEALAVLRTAADLAVHLGAREPEAMAAMHMGRVHLLRRELDQARAALSRSVACAEAAGWLALTPMPETLIAEVELLEGDIASALRRVTAALALAREVEDPCWQCLATSGLGRVRAAAGDDAEARRLMSEAPTFSRRAPDASRWIEAYALDGLCSVGIERGWPGVERWVSELEALTARTGMHELLARAAMHRARLGEPGAIQTAIARVAVVDNPVLHGEIGALSRSLETSNAPSHAAG